MQADRARSLGYLLVGLADLADKYAALAELGAGEPGRTTARRDAMRKVAARFPAALREFDQTQESQRTERARQIDEAMSALIADFDRGQGRTYLDDPSRAWIRPTAELHAYLRELLKVKRFLAGRAPDGAVMTEFATWHAEAGDPRWPLEHWTRERLAAVASPPRGRVTDLAYEEVATRHGLDAARLRHELYPHVEEED
jgi:hypothetical protein